MDWGTFLDEAHHCLFIRVRSFSERACPQPTSSPEPFDQPGIVRRKRRKPQAEFLAIPIGYVRSCRIPELVLVENSTHVARRVPREWIILKQAEGTRIVMEKLPD